MKKVLVAWITICVIVALLMVNGIITDFSFEAYLSNLETAFTGFPSLPNFSNIGFEDMSLFNWEPLGNLLLEILKIFVFPFDFLAYLIKIIGALFMIGV